MRMIFTCEHDGPFSNIIGRVHHETMNETLGEIIEDFELFLKGCGFNFDGKLDIVPMENYYGKISPEEQLSVPEYYEEILNRHKDYYAD